MYLLNKRFSKVISGCLLLEAWGESTALPSVLSFFFSCMETDLFYFQSK